MTGFLILAGVAITCFIILYIIFKLPDDHVIYKLMGLGLVLILLILMSGVTYNNKDTCELMVNSSFVNSSNNHVQYTYRTECIEDTSSSALSFIKATTWFLRISFMYFLAYYILQFREAYNRWVKNKREK